MTGTRSSAETLNVQPSPAALAVLRAMPSAALGRLLATVRPAVELDRAGRHTHHLVAAVRAELWRREVTP